jgi:hypothetical protein
MSSQEQNVSITYFMDELENNNSGLDIDELLNEIENAELNYDLSIPQIINYNENFTVKELLLICEYYGFAKDLKSNKCNKEEIVQILVDFEKNTKNYDIVFRRQNSWFYINELKNDKFMKKYVLW